MSKPLDMLIASVMGVQAKYPSIEWELDEYGQLIVWDTEE
jgi:hypothetical protein